MTRCQRCEARLGRDAAFCSACGAPVGEPDSGIVTEVELDSTTRWRDVALDRPKVRRGRAVATIAVVSFVAVIGTSVIARGRDGGTQTGTTVPTSIADRSVSRTSTTDDWTVPLTTVADEASTTTTAGGPVSIGSAPLLGEASGLDALVAAAGSVHRIDLDAATTTRTNTEFLGDENLIATSLGLLSPPNSPSPPTLYPYDGSPPRSIGEGQSNFVGEGPPGRLWFVEYSQNSGPRVYYVEPGSGVLGTLPDIEVPFANFIADGSSGVLTVAPGGTYRIRESQPPERISDGEVIAAANGYLVERTCDRQLHCVVQVIDTRTGAQRVVPTPVSSGVNDFGALVSPDGRWVVMMKSEASTDNGFRARVTIAGVDGSLVEIGAVENQCFGSGCPGAPRWSHDGSWLVGLLRSGEVWVWRPGLAAPRLVPLAVPMNAVSVGVVSIVLIPHAARFGSPPAPGS